MSFKHNYLVNKITGIDELTFKDDELREYIEDSIKEWKENGTWSTEWKEELHHHLFNEDHYIIGTYKAKKWLGDNIFEAIGYIHDYETDHFGEVNTTLSNPEAVANMFAYIRGEELLANRKEETTWRGV
tara:strand:+ start:1145 stop:1531 length:387 start_codon:yes stop_codon:yes gene_type:complete